MFEKGRRPRPLASNMPEPRLPAMILDEIVAHKRRAEIPGLPPVDRAALTDLPPSRGFREALRRDRGEPVRVIAESKKGSPSKGVFVEDYDPVLTGLRYVEGGAAAISVLTDERFFHGRLEHLTEVHAQVPLPILRKDFVVDERQVAEARLAGADAVLLIVAILADGELRDLQGFAREIGLDVLVEVHDADEAARAATQGADAVGVNNRDLRDFSVDLRTTFDLVPGLLGDDRVVVSESGIEEREQCRRLEEAGVDAVLVGEHLMRSGDPGDAIRRLRGRLA